MYYQQFTKLKCCITKCRFVSSSTTTENTYSFEYSFLCIWCGRWSFFSFHSSKEAYVKDKRVSNGERERERDGMQRRYEGIVKRKQNETLETPLLAFVCLNKYLVLEKSPTRAHLSLPSFYLPPHLLQIIHSLSLSIKYLLNFVEF